ncbi:MAG: response regulator [Smithella sp.]
MKNQSGENQELQEEISILKQKIQDLEHLAARGKKTEEEIGIIENRLLRTELLTLSGHWEYDRQSKRVLVSEGFRRICGLAGPECTISQMHELALPAYRPMLDETLNGLIQEKRPYDAEFKIKRVDTGEIVDIHCIAEYDSQKQVASGIVHVVTKHKHVHEKLQESRKRLEYIIEFIPDAILAINQKGMVIAWNRAMETMTGVKKEDMLGKGNYEYALPFYGERRPLLIDYAMHPDRENMEKHYTDIQMVGDILIGESFAPDIPPAGIHQYATATVLRDEKDEVIAAIECIHDITERKELAERLKRAEKMEALGALAGGVAHDLNNVLGVLVGYSELLADQLPVDTILRRYADNILKSGVRGAAIIQDLLTLARRGVTVSEVVNLNKLVGDYFKTPELEKLKEDHPDVIISTDLEDGLLNIKGSPVHLGKTIMNLISNAVEAISGRGEVIVRTANCYLDHPVKGYDEMNEGDYAVLTVSDTGSGISPKDMGKIFEPFYTKKVMGRSGTGLGLAVVWGTVKDHNGYIDVQSEPGEETIFTLYFPVTREETVKVEKSASPVDYMGKGESILVVDDVKEQRELAMNMLEKLGYQVSAVAGGEEAIEYLQSRQADLIVLDMIMEPGMDGMETYRNIAKMNPHQKTIIVSGFSETDRVKNAQEMGAGAFIRKPYILEKIGLAVKNELARKETLAV